MRKVVALVLFGLLVAAFAFINIRSAKEPTVDKMPMPQQLLIGAMSVAIGTGVGVALYLLTLLPD